MFSQGTTSAMGGAATGNHIASEAKAHYLAQTDARAPTNIVPNDPASLRQQIAAMCQLCDRLTLQRNRLRDIADFVLGGEPEEGIQGQNGVAVVGGAVSELVSMFTSVGLLLNQIDRQVERLTRVSS